MTSDYTRADVVAALKNVGIAVGDTLFTHGNVGFFGRAEGAGTKEEVYALFKDAVFEVVGESGTWAMPTFTYSFFEKKMYDKNETPSGMGTLNEMMRKDTEAFRSNDPNFSVVAVGANAKKLTENVPAHSFGLDSFWDRFLHLDGKFCNFNFDAGSTFVHYVEKRLSVPYRFDKEFEGEVIENGKSVKKTVYHFVHTREQPDLLSDFRLLDILAKKTGRAKVSNVGKGQILVISARDTFKTIEEGLKTEPLMLTLSGFRTSGQQATE